MSLKNPLTVNLEMDEMWSRVRSKTQSLEKLTSLISNFNLNISCVYTDNNFSYQGVIPRNILKIGKQNTQKIERKHLTFRSRLKRLARKTICYSKSLDMHTILLGLLINFTEFSRDKLF